MREKSGFLSFCHVLTVLHASFFSSFWAARHTTVCLIYLRSRL